MNIPPITLTEINAALPPSTKAIAFLKNGGQGAVFKGLFNSADCAIKLFNTTDPEINKRISREIIFLKSCNHNNIVKILDNFEITIHGVSFSVVIYELITGGDLGDLYGSLTPLTNELIVSIGLDMSKAIKHMWETPERIVHRDIKPGNIVLRDNGEYVLVDFAFARHVTLSDMTVFGTRGTPGYMSPEQVFGRKNLTYKSDIFSLGVTLYFLSTGKHPFNKTQPTTDFSFPLIDTHANLLDGSTRNLIHSMMKQPPIERPLNIVQRFELLKGR